MESLPQELLDQIFRCMEDDDEIQDNERIWNFPPIVRKAICNSRLVQRRWNESHGLEVMFAAVLGFTPVIWYNHRIPVLEEIGASRWGAKMRIISFCGMDFGLVEKGADKRWELGREEMEKELPILEYLVHLLQQFRGVMWLRYHTIHPKCLDGSWPNWKVSCEDDFFREESRFLPPASGEHTWSGVQMENEWIFERIMNAVYEADLVLRVFEMPLLGNRASYGALSSWRSDAVFENFGATLTHLSMSVFTETLRAGGTIQYWAGQLECLETLDLSFSTPMHRDRIWTGWRPWVGSHFRFMDMDSMFSPSQLPTLKELRVSADNQYTFTASDINEFLSMFPNLKVLAFAHIQLVYGDWSGFLESLTRLNLETLWLVNPRNVVIPPAPQGVRPPWSAVEYQEDKYLSGAAKEVKLAQADSPPITADNVPERRLDFDYPGFAMFDRLV